MEHVNVLHQPENGQTKRNLIRIKDIWFKVFEIPALFSFNKNFEMKIRKCETQRKALTRKAYIK